MSGTKVDSICKKYDGNDAFARLYGTFQEQIETALVMKSGTRDGSIQCLIKRNKKTSMFYLYLAVTPSLADEGMFLLAARSFKTGAYTEYIISLDANDFSQGSNAYVGKLRSNFLRSNYKVYDSQPPHEGAKPTNGKASRIFASKQISPQVPAGHFEVGQVTYKLNLLGPRGPRRMITILQNPSADTKPCDVMKKLNKDDGSCYKILKTKSPRWHEKLQCWCLNFRGRVTTASVKNFQLLATVDEESQPSKETVILQFGKVGDDIFTMDYKHPLSVFQAFAICLTSFGNKLTCE